MYEKKEKIFLFFLSHSLSMISVISVVNYATRPNHFIVGLVKRKLKKLPKKATVYVAKDDQNNIQGVAIASTAKGCNWLNLLVTNPKNIPIHPFEETLRGVGTKLVAHVANDILQGKKHRCKKLHLWARPTAIPFYQKLGFEIINPKSRSETTSMILRKRAMRVLVEKASILKEKSLCSGL